MKGIFFKIILLVSAKPIDLNCRKQLLTLLGSMKLEDYISKLLRNHNCVIVPDFGGFIANYKSAVIDDSRKMIHPPSKSILFNKILINNDGLLGSEISENESISYDDAIGSISKNVEDWKTVLENGGRIEIGEIGFLCKHNGDILFEQNREVNILLDAYGLSSVNFITFEKVVTKEDVQEKIKRVEVVKENRPSIEIEEKEVPQEVEKKVTPVIVLDPKSTINEVVEAEKEEKIIQLKAKSNKWKYLAAAVAIPFLFYSYWIPMETDFLNTGQIQFSDFNPIQSQKEKVYQVRDDHFNFEMNEEIRSWENLTENLSENVQVYNYQFDEELYIPVRLTTEVVLTEREIIADQNSSEISEGSYFVISGCFSVKNNANNLIEDLLDKGFTAKILDKKNGLHRVTTGGYGTKNDANNALDKLRGQGFSGWILKK